MVLKLYEFTASSTGPSEYLDIALIEVDRSRIGLETSVYNTTADSSYCPETVEQPEIGRRVTKTANRPRRLSAKSHCYQQMHSSALCMMEASDEEYCVNVAQ